MQVGVRSDRGTVQDEMSLCALLAARFGEGDGVAQILVTPFPTPSGGSLNDAQDEPSKAGARWSSASHSCRPDPV